MAETITERRWTSDGLGRPERVTSIGDRVVLFSGRPLGDPDISFRELGEIAIISYKTDNGCEQGIVVVPVKGRGRLVAEAVLRGADNIVFGWAKSILGE